MYQNIGVVASGQEPPAFHFDRFSWQWRRESVVYLLHFDAPICPGHPTRHYLGWTCNLQERLHLHAQGRGARLTQVALERGITWQVAAVWPGDRGYERLLKLRKNTPRMCPVCQRELRACASVGTAFDIPF